MDLQKAKILLEKINALHKSMSMDANNVAAIEKDLMLNYLQQLYACYLSENKPTTHNAPERKFTRSTPTPTPKTSSRPAPPSVPKVERVVETPPPPPPVEAKAKPVERPSTPPPPPVAKEVPAAKKEKVVKTERPVVATVSAGESDGLFEHTAAKELSEKLSAMPIKDLSKAMGLNEKLLTINNLFDGDNTVFNETMSALNGLSNFAEAKTFLQNHVIGKYDWTNKAKKTKAKEFIKLIRRRYN
ncbi:MAG: hypothetical protein AAFO94_07645 [Bacteroidota bacterium]